MKHHNAHGEGKRKGAFLTKKKAAALALCVSLWMAGGSVASAFNEIYIDADTGNKVSIRNDSSPGTVTPAIGTTGTTKLTVTGGDWSGDRCSIYGGYSLSQSASGYELVLDGVTNVTNVWGAKAQNFNGDAINNSVTLINSTVAEYVYGGATAAYEKDRVTGNKLYLSGENAVGNVRNFQTINIKGAIWGKPVLTLTGDGIVDNETTNDNLKKAEIHTENITFSSNQALLAGQHTVLIKNKMGGYDANKIYSGKYTVGTTLQGTGEASISGNNLIYTLQSVEEMTAREQTHNTVMGAEVGMAALSMGNDFIGAATEGLSLAANTGADGVASFAQMGGASMRQETGSHVDVHTWNAILGLGHQNKKERGTMEYGAFFEYGTGNYTTHAENDLRGDGSTRYVGGGVLGKYTRPSGVYFEGSLRAGSVHDDARNVMSDAFGNPYSYDTNAPYLGFHLGVGKDIALSDGNSVDVYGKYFFNRKNGVSFNAGGHYDLDAVTSSVIRIGARYTVKRDKWNFYGGLAYEHELDGKATGTADGAAIRAAETKGGSARLELGATMKPGDNSPWSLDLNLSGFAGKKQGVTGGISVAFMF